MWRWSSVSPRCGGGGSGGGTNLAKFCSDAEALDANYSSTFEGLNPPSIDTYKSLASSLKTLAGEAPSDIKGDLNTMASGAEEAVKSGSGFLDSSAVGSAADHVGNYVDENCASGS